MRFLIRTAAPIALAALAVSGCAGDGANMFQTGSVTATAPAPISTPRVSAECQTLAGQIEALRKDGTLEKLEKASAGKSQTVPFKRDALVKQASYNKLTTDFQAKCGPNAIVAQIQQDQAKAAAQAARAAATEVRAPSEGNGG